MGKLTATGIRALKHPGDRDWPVAFLGGDGLSLQVTKNGSKSWLLRYQLNGRAREMGLGPAAGTAAEEAAGGISLARARDLAREAKAALRSGVDPIAARQTRRAEAEQRAQREADRSFCAVANSLIAAKKPGWRNEKHGAQWEATLKAYAYPKIGDKPVARITTDDVLDVLRPVWTRTPETASRLRQRMEAVLDAARALGWREGENPARWKANLAHHLPPPRKVRAIAHHPALPWPQMPAFMKELAKREGTAAKALTFLILTACRSGEVRGMRWSEVHFDNATWVIPGERMKAGRMHRVPLSPPALAVLEAMKERRQAKSDLVFPGAKSGSALSDMAISMLVRGMACDGLKEGQRPRWHDPEGNAIVPHGFRSTFRDWAGETRPEGREVVERALAHTIRDKAEAAYARSDLLEKRRALMDAWAQ
ncbi:MAG TPA: integrase arm-type DNA-binding domain-containing protein, partial [Acetobacteraceae bacterium]|nr:integrase arm-type DNA-binding domain-containing protein [Acetobacteraceae bacterium]